MALICDPPTLRSKIQSLTRFEAKSKAYDDHEKARKEFHRFSPTVYNDSEFDSQWGDNAFVARVQERVAAS